jgi:hypothetical protein
MPKHLNPELPTQLTDQAFELPQDSEIIIKPKKRIGAYDAFNNNPAYHLRREGWSKNFNFSYPEDVALGIVTDINRRDIANFQEIFYRFLNLGFIHQWGDHCVLMSSLLRRVLALHGYKAKIKQVHCYWQNDEKQQTSNIGLMNGAGDGSHPKEGSIDAHIVVSCNGYILDFSMTSIHLQYGMLAPRAAIGWDSENDEYQDIGIGGEVAWVDVPIMHPIVKHWRYEQKPMEMDLSRQYFRQYQF